MGGHERLSDQKRKVLKEMNSLKCPTRNKVSSNSSEFPDLVNKYFSSIAHNLASKMPNPLKNFTNIYQR